MLKKIKFFFRVAIDLVNKKINDMKSKPAFENESLLEIYLKNENLDVKDVVGMACDMLLAGVDTVKTNKNKTNKFKFIILIDYFKMLSIFKLSILYF